MKKRESIVCEHFFPHPPRLVWRCLTTPELHAQWWASGDIKAEVGHRFELDMGPFGQQPCVVLEVIPEKLFKYSFSEDLNSVITWELIPSNSGTLLKLTHEGFDLDSPLGRQAYHGMKNGWPKVISKMTPLLDGMAFASSRAVR